MHDQPPGRVLRVGQVLTVLCQGAADMTASWTLGSTAHVSSMVESEPGLYVGKFRVPKGLVLKEETISVELTSPRGFRSVMRVEHKPLSTAAR